VDEAVDFSIAKPILAGEAGDITAKATRTATMATVRFGWRYTA